LEFKKFLVRHIENKTEAGYYHHHQLVETTSHRQSNHNPMTYKEVNQNICSSDNMVLHHKTTKTILCSWLCNIHPLRINDNFDADSASYFRPKLKIFSLTFPFQTDNWFSQFIHPKIKS